VGKVQHGGDLAEIMAMRQDGSSVFGSSASVDVTGTAILAEQTGRRRGVVVRCTHASIGLLVGSTIADCVFPIGAAAAGQNNETTVFGIGPIYLKGNGTVSSAAWHYV
jgi:hypothetical protein